MNDMTYSERQLVSAYLREKKLMRPIIETRISNERDERVGLFGKNGYKVKFHKIEFTSNGGMR